MAGPAGSAEENGVALLGLNLSSKPKWLQLICGGGFLFGYMVNGVCERLWGGHGVRGTCARCILGQPSGGGFQNESCYITGQMLFCSTLVGLPFLIRPMVLTGELFTAWTECSKNMYVYLVLVFEAVATFIGQISVLCLIALFGAATTAMVTTARKALTLLLSYIFFPKPLTGQHGSGMLLITMGILLKMMPEPFPKNYSTLPTSDPKHGPRAEAVQSKEEKVDYKV